MKKFNAVLLSGVLTVSTVALAASSVNQENSLTVNTSLQMLEQQQMTKSAQEWGLTAEEWLRYETLKKGRRGVLSPGLDPLTMLGIEARSDEERRHFAELTVKQEFQRVEAELAFQREVNSAWMRVYPGVLPVQDLRSEVSNARQALFVKDSCPACERKLAQLMKSNRPLDIYLVDSGGKDEAVRSWAKKHNIPAEKVKSRQVTLNHDNGMRLKYGNGLMPVVLQQGAQGMAARKLMWLAMFIALPECLAAQSVPEGYYRVAQAENVSAEALYSVALTETSRKLVHGVRPWPWTINVAGKGYRYASRNEAYQALLGFMRRYPLKLIDVGIAQVNLGWNGHYFTSAWEAFDPYINLHVAARILRACYERSPGSWISAAGCYHHPAGGKPAQTYKAIVSRHLSTLQPSVQALAFNQGGTQ